MTSGPHESLGRGRSLAEPAFPDDDGSADAEVRRLLADPDLDDVDLARRLREVRLLTCVVAVLDEVADDGSDKSSHMAVVSMVNEAGQRGLLAFTGTDSLAGWNPEARPVPVTGRDAARSALDDGAAAVVIDVVGPSVRALAGPALLALADLVDLAAVTAAVQTALVGLTSDGWVDVEVRDGRPDGAADVIVAVRAHAGGHPDGRTAEVLARQAARLLAERPAIHALVPGGIGVVVG